MSKALLKDIVRRVRAGSPLSRMEREAIADVLDEVWFRTAQQQATDRRKRKRVLEAFVLMAKIESTEKRLKRSKRTMPRGGWEDAAHAEVAQLLHISPGALRKRLNRARIAAEELGPRLNLIAFMNIED